MPHARYSSDSALVEKRGPSIVMQCLSKITRAVFPVFTNITDSSVLLHVIIGLFAHSFFAGSLVSFLAHAGVILAPIPDIKFFLQLNRSYCN
jgi:ABC-type multidrug transport system fused ATPase/permease subunit